MIRRPPRSTLDRSSAASDVYKRQLFEGCVADRAVGRAISVHPTVLHRTVDPTLPGRPALEAVSYTHLRAHETVLDLVCRLLLEKKKNKLSLIHI